MRDAYDSSGDHFVQSVCHWCDSYCGGACNRGHCDECGELCWQSELVERDGLRLCEGCAEDGVNAR